MQPSHGPQSHKAAVAEERGLSFTLDSSVLQTLGAQTRSHVLHPTPSRGINCDCTANAH